MHHSLGQELCNSLILLGDFVNEVGSLVLVDKLGDPLGLLLAGVSHSLGIGLVGQSQVQVMS